MGASNPIRVLVTGSRDWDDNDALIETFRDWYIANAGPENPILVSGACPRGADAYAEELWRRQGWPVEQHPADWNTHGKAAGFIRNQEMVDSGVDICFAFIKDNSKGASHTKRLADRAGVPVILVERTSAP